MVAEHFICRRSGARKVPPKLELSVLSGVGSLCMEALNEDSRRSWRGLWTKVEGIRICRGMKSS